MHDRKIRQGSLAEHKRSVHESVKYQCSECDHQSTSKQTLAGHQRARHVLPNKKKQENGVP